MVIGQYKIDRFEWNKSTHTLVAHFKDLSLSDLKRVPDRIEVIGKVCNVSFIKRGEHPNCVLYKPLNEAESAKIIAPPKCIWREIILVIRDWR